MENENLVFSAEAEDAGKRLDAWLSERLPDAKYRSVAAGIAKAVI